MEKWLLKQHSVVGLGLLLLMMMGLIAIVWAVLLLGGLLFSALLKIELNVIQASTVATTVLFTSSFISGFLGRIWKRSESVEKWISWMVPGTVVLIWLFALVFPVPK